MYPFAHTCFNLLDLPEYSSIAILMARLEVAMAHANEFTDL